MVVKHLWKNRTLRGLLSFILGPNCVDRRFLDFREFFETSFDATDRFGILFIPSPGTNKLQKNRVKTRNMKQECIHQLLEQ